MKTFVVFVVLVHVLESVSGVEVYEGAGSVLLPCRIATVPFRPTVIWRRNKLDPSTVHQRSQIGDDLKDQNQLYDGRTSMRPDALENGDLGLTLRNPVVSDSGDYTCSIVSFGTDDRLAKVELQVKERYIFPVEARVLLTVLLISLVTIVVLGVYVRRLKNKVQQAEVDSGVESVVLLCRTKVHLPEDATVEWTDRNNRKVNVYPKGSEQDQFYKGRTEMKRNPLNTGDLSLTLKYPTDRDGGPFTCIVHNKERKVLVNKKVELLVRVQQVVEVDSGVESVLLPCKTLVHLPEDAKVEWKYGSYTKVHVYQNGSDQLQEQYEVYKNRTEIKKNLLETGDLSLTLKNPTAVDSKIYTCTVYDKDENILMKRDVELKVQERTQSNDSRTRTSSTDPTPLMDHQSV